MIQTGANIVSVRCFIASIALVILSNAAFEASAVETDRQAYARVLDSFVNQEGRVDYAALKQSPEDLNAYLASVAQLDRADYQSWSDTEQIAFWINAYNAYTLKAIIDNYPIQASFFGQFRFPNNSIRQISGVWDELAWPVMGTPMTLDEMEHETLRKDFNEPRIHFGVNCASVGCPLLRTEPYVGERLDQQLDEQVQAYLERPLDFRLNRDEERIYLSKILDWYGQDFLDAAPATGHFDHLGETERAVMNFLYPYLDPDQQAFLREHDVDVSYISYDWSLNEQA